MKRLLTPLAVALLATPTFADQATEIEDEVAEVTIEDEVEVEAVKELDKSSPKLAEKLTKAQDYNSSRSNKPRRSSNDTDDDDDGVPTDEEAAGADDGSVSATDDWRSSTRTKRKK